VISRLLVGERGRKRQVGTKVGEAEGRGRWVLGRKCKRLIFPFYICRGWPREGKNGAIPPEKDAPRERAEQRAGRFYFLAFVIGRDAERSERSGGDPFSIPR